MKKILILLGFGCTLQHVSAQVAVNNDLKGLINQSFTYFPRFRELEQTVTINEQNVDLAATANKPIVNAVGNYTYVAPVAEIPFPDGNGHTNIVKFQPNHNINGGIQVIAPIYDFGKTKLEIERARQGLQVAKTNIDYNRTQLAAQVANIYYTIIYLQQAINVQDTVISVLEANKKLMEDRFKRGDALRLDVLTIQNNIDLEQNRKTDLQNQLQKQYNLLQFATGQSRTHATKTFDFTLPVQNDSAALRLAQANNYEYTLAQERIKAAELDAAIARLGNKPALSANGQAGVRNGYQPKIGEIKPNYSLGVNVSVPLYNGGRTKKQVALAESVVKQNQLAIESLNNQYTRDIEQALTDVRSNLERLNTVQEQINIAKEALWVTQTRYTNGIATNVDLLNANSNLQRVQLAQIQYQYQLTLAQIELARLTGVKYW
ncbi:MAG: TolC family protein [Chitinophagaceae bacterium]